MKAIALVGLLASCQSTRDPFANAVLVTRSDVRVLGTSIGIAPNYLLMDRAPVVTALRAGKLTSELVVVYTPDASAAVVLAAWRAAHEAGLTRVDLESLVAGALQLVCAHQQFAPPPPPDSDTVQMSIWIDPRHRTVGVSRVNEFKTYDAPYAGYAGYLHEEKVSAFFNERNDVEVAAAVETTGEQLTGAIAPVCREFSDVLPMAIAELSANPDGATTAPKMRDRGRN